ncbi:MAG TPA: AsmA family protein [Burkholderiales bacterium]|nr:AsmA family protein [Burkholderiales bacterium]
MSTAARRILITLVVIVFVVPALLLAGGILLLQSETTEGWVEDRISDAIDREVEIESIGLDWGWPPAITVERLRIGNPEWAKTPHLIDAADLRAQVEVPPLLRGRIVIPYFSAREATAGLERDGERATWRFGGGESKPSPFLVKRVNVENGTIHYRDANESTALEVALKGSLGEGGELDVTATGKLRGEQAKVTARVPSLQPSPETPIEIDAKAAIGRTNIVAKGNFAANLESIDMRLHLSGPTLRALEKLSGIKLPDSPPYTLSGHLRHTGAEWLFQQFEGKVGDSDLRGDVAYRSGGERPFLKADLRSKLLDFDDLGPLIGAPPNPSESATPEQKEKSAEQAAKRKVLPSEPLGIDRWKAMDADVKLEAHRVERPKQVPIDALATHIVLKNSVLRLEPLAFGVAKGRIKANITLDGSEDAAQGSMDMDIQGVKLSQVFPSTTKGIQPSLGTLYGRGKLKGHGASVAELIGSSNGELSMAVDGGQVNLLLIELLGLDVAEAATLLGEGKRQKEVGLRCAVADFAIKDGIAHPEVFIIDTTDTLVKVEGSVNLDKEQLDLVTHPEPKDMSIFALRSPVQLTGPFRDPKVRPKLGPIVARGAAAAALAVANPLLALLPFIETGPGKDSNCAALLGRAKSKGAVKKKE